MRTGLGAILFGAFAQPKLAGIIILSAFRLCNIIRKSLALRCEQFRACRFLAEQGSRRSQYLTRIGKANDADRAEISGAEPDLY